jgi:hypothetical protein
MTRAAAPSQPTYATLFPPQGFGPGEYTLAGAGGTQVAAFTAKAAMGTSITVTNLSGNAIDRSKPLTINWTGSGLDEVSIQIGTQRSATTKQAAWLSCNVSAASGTFTIPTAALAGLLPTSADQTAYITIDGHPFARQFDASLPGIGQIDVGVFGTELSVSTGVSIK